MRNKRFQPFILFFFSVFILVNCRREKTETTETAIPGEHFITAPLFNADSAYYFIFTQVEFGPRIPNSISHKTCADYLVGKLGEFGANVVVQEFSEEAYDGQVLELKNIIASINTDKPRKILLAAHWDTRPFADKDTLNPARPFDGANDGASGVGVLLEIARVLSVSPKPQIGVDIILFDGEDFGEPEFEEVVTPHGETWWCLGSQYWSNNPHVKNYSAYYGILLDMVGARNAKFYREGVSLQYARKITDRAWKIASLSGYGEFFIGAASPGITDDHLFINRDAQIPTISIVDYDANRGDSYFPAYHHTHQDNMDIIDKKTLEAVGQTLLNLIYNE